MVEAVVRTGCGSGRAELDREGRLPSSSPRAAPTSHTCSKNITIDLHTSLGKQITARRDSESENNSGGCGCPNWGNCSRRAPVAAHNARLWRD